MATKLCSGPPIRLAHTPIGDNTRRMSEAVIRDGPDRKLFQRFSSGNLSHKDMPRKERLVNICDDQRWICIEPNPLQTYPMITSMSNTNNAI